MKPRAPELPSFRPGGGLLASGPCGPRSTGPGPQDYPGPFAFVFHDGLKPIAPRPWGARGRVCCTGGPCPVRIQNWGSAMAPFFPVNLPAETKPFPWRAKCRPPCGPISQTHTCLEDNRGAEDSTSCGSPGRLDFPTRHGMPTDRPTERPTDQTTGLRPSDRPADRPHGHPMDRPVDRPGDRQTERQLSLPIQRQTERSIDRPSDQPT